MAASKARAGAAFGRAAQVSERPGQPGEQAPDSPLSLVSPGITPADQALLENAFTPPPGYQPPDSPAAAVPSPDGGQPEEVTLALPAPLPDGEGAGRARTNDAIPPKVYALVRRYRAKTGADAALIVAAAVSKAYVDRVLPGLAERYRSRGALETAFGSHAPQKQRRAAAPVRLNYNPTLAEFRVYGSLGDQLGISRAVLVTLSLAYFFGVQDPAAIA